jgi:hypothetical protein
LPGYRNRKTKTLQVIIENLSDAGVPVLAMDIKGDLSGLGASGTMNPIIEKRSKQMAWSGCQIIILLNFYLYPRARRSLKGYCF